MIFEGTLLDLSACSSFQIIKDGSAEWTCPHLTEKLPDSVCPQYPYVQFYTIATQQCHQSVQMCVHILGWKCMSLSLSVYCPSMLRFFNHVLPCIHAMNVHREINTYAEALWSHQLISCIYYGLCFYLHLFSACPNMSSCPALMSGSQNTAVLWQEWYKILSPTQGCSWRTSLSAVGRHHFFSVRGSCVKATKLSWI